MNKTNKQTNPFKILPNPSLARPLIIIILADQKPIFNALNFAIYMIRATYIVRSVDEQFWSGGGFGKTIHCMSTSIGVRKSCFRFGVDTTSIKPYYRFGIATSSITFSSRSGIGIPILVNHIPLFSPANTCSIRRSQIDLDPTKDLSNNQIPSQRTRWQYCCEGAGSYSAVMAESDSI